MPGIDIGVFPRVNADQSAPSETVHFQARLTAGKLPRRRPGPARPEAGGCFPTRQDTHLKTPLNHCTPDLAAADSHRQTRHQADYRQNRQPRHRALLAATLLALAEPQIKTLLEIPPDTATAAVIMLGWPEKPFPKSLKRKPLADTAFLDRYGAPLPGADAYV